MSHELRTPLNAIIGYAHLFLDGVLGELGEQQRDKIGRIDANAKHLVTLIDDLLDISRIESGRMPVHAEPLSLRELIEELMREVEPLIGRTRLSVTTAFAEDLPEVHTDRQKVKQIVMNLISNAIKFTSEGFVHVQCSHEACTDRLAVAVSDTGIGIPADQQARIFEEFQQVDDSNTRRHGGTGLGLAISKRLAEVLGGEIQLASRPGTGSTFTLSFPRSQKGTAS
jgi:signal transduction histidine kinase